MSEYMPNRLQDARTQKMSDRISTYYIYINISGKMRAYMRGRLPHKMSDGHQNTCAIKCQNICHGKDHTKLKYLLPPQMPGNKRLHCLWEHKMERLLRVHDFCMFFKVAAQFLPRFAQIKTGITIANRFPNFPCPQHPSSHLCSKHPCPEFPLPQHRSSYAR